ncbi:major tail protein [Helcococcus bovis]|uniref:major tail protein n=1 Tax=Helcococcus bovis TaxID=3153252 RepID=UPI0038BBF70B
MNKVKYGLSNVHVYPITSETSDSITYGQAIKIPGAVSLSLSPEGSSEPFYADNTSYYVATSNNGYSGSLEIALIPEDFLIKILGMKKDTSSGVITESGEDKNTPFALGFQFEGDEKGARHILYKCSATRPNIEGETVGDSVKPKTDSFDFTAVGRISDKLVKARVDQGESAYNDFFKKPFEAVRV